MTDETDTPPSPPSQIVVKFAAPYSVLHTIEYQGVHPMQMLVAGQAIIRAAETTMRHTEDELHARASAGAILVPGRGM